MENKLRKTLFILLICFIFNTNFILAQEELPINSTDNMSDVIDNNDVNNSETQENNSVIDNNEITENVEENNKAYKYQVVIADNADLLTPEEENRLYDQIVPLSEFGNIVFASTREGIQSTQSYAQDYYHSRFGSDSGTLFLIDMGTREIYIFSDGNNYNIITSNKAYIITDNVYRYATNGDYYLCASEAFEQIGLLLNGHKIAEPMRYISNTFIALSIAAFINFFIVMNKSRLKKSSEKEIIRNCKVKFDIGEINVAKTGTKKVYRPPSSSSGGSSGGGGGGGSSGGGGGHGF